MKKLILLSAVCVLFASCGQVNNKLIKAEVTRKNNSVDTILIYERFLIDEYRNLKETHNPAVSYRTIAKDVVLVKRLDK